MTAGRCCLAKLITCHCDWLFLKTAVSKESALHFHQTVRTQIQTPVIKGKITVNGVFLFTLTFFFVGGKRKSICCVLEERCLDWMNIRDFFWTIVLMRCAATCSVPQNLMTVCQSFRERKHLHLHDFRGWSLHKKLHLSLSSMQKH